MRPAPRAPGIAVTLLAVLLAATFLGLDALWRYRGIQRYNQYNPTLYPLPVEQTAESGRRSLFLDPDCYLWNIFARDIARGEALRVRWTNFDNYPYGREAMWSSGYAYLLAGAGLLWRYSSGSDLTSSLERASIVVNPLLLLVFTAVLGVLAHRRFSWLAAVLTVVSVAGSNSIVQSFMPGRPDHHGLVTMALLGTLFCLFMGGAGYVADPAVPAGGLAARGFRFPDERGARRWFTASAVFAALGMWVSALSTSLLLVGIGIAVPAGLLIAGRQEPGPVRYLPSLWTRWGLVGGGTAFAFYLLEFFPGHLGMRLEVNHPLYHVSWCGGAVLLTLVSDHIVRRARPRGAALLKTLLAAVAVAGLPATIAIGGTAVYRLRDTLLWRWHQNIFEFQPYATANFLRDFGVFILAWIVAAALLAVAKARREERGLAAFALAGAVAPLALALWQSRWGSLFASTLALAPLAALVICRGVEKLALRRATTLLLALALTGHFGYYGYHRLKEAISFRDIRHTNLQLRVHMAARDAAEYLRARAGNSPVVLMSTPWLTTTMGYMGNFQGIGSLYFENLSGLRAVADFFAAGNEEDARKIARERRVTHIAIIESDFNLRNYYFLKHGRVDREGVAQTFGKRFIDADLPWWITGIPYVPRDREFRVNTGMYGVHLYRVDPGVSGSGG